MKNDPSRHWTMLSPYVPGEFLTAQAQQAEAAGLAGVAAPEFYGNPLVPLSHCGAVTTRVQLLSAISLALVHNPFSIAMSAMDIDRLSGGRFVLGLGPSAREMVEGFHGVTGYGRPLARLREAIEVIRLVIAKSHTGEMDRFDGEFHHHDWSRFQGNHMPPLRTEIPIWIAATQMGLVRLAGEVADGLTSHPIWSVDWALRQGQSTLADTLKGAGRDRAAFHWQAGFFVAVTSDPKQAIEDAKATVALYAGVRQYEPFFAAHGFGAEAQACQAAVERHDYAGAGAAAVTDDMAATFVIAGSADECRKRLEPMWTVVDSFLLVPPFLQVPLDRLINYTLALADTFYA
ncbi:MAG: LLM class flavin-dependent oxidoreductase [Actinobacteria bacterium]|nr:LLM class flavin-dependent oxidoreductase [Actinomycetota bacterium]